MTNVSPRFGPRYKNIMIILWLSPQTAAISSPQSPFRHVTMRLKTTARVTPMTSTARTMPRVTTGGPPTGDKLGIPHFRKTGI